MVTGTNVSLAHAAGYLADKSNNPLAAVVRGVVDRCSVMQWGVHGRDSVARASCL